MNRPMNGIELLGAPLFISWQITRDCDLACVHCCTDSAPGHGLADELTEAEALDLADQIVAAEVPYVMLCGGEPLRVPHFIALAERLGHAGVMLKIETNGQLLDQPIIDRLASLPIRSIQISLDADTQDVYGRQRPGASLAKVHAACRAVREAGMPLEVTFAPTRLNIDQLDAVMRRAAALGAFRFNTGRLMRIGRAARLWHKIRPDEADEVKFRNTLDSYTAGLVSSGVDTKMEICYLPFTVADGLDQNRDKPPATMLIMPNGLVKVVGASGYICSDLGRSSLLHAWDDYRAAWHDQAVLDDIDRCITDEGFQARANDWISTLNGVNQHA
ncbi:MAG: radical SAM protein [Acidiphilium sp.]|nr:radical SAM protein [Acidiphilium sp.]MDD4935110.1 radical SAM protein [Acidiphilium sp.]